MKKYSDRILELANVSKIHKSVLLNLNEGKHPNVSVYGYMDLLWAAMTKIISKSAGKRVTFGKYQAISTGAWMIDYKGYTKSDFEASGWISMYTDSKQSDTVVLTISHDSMYGKSEETWRFKFNDDASQVSTNAGKWINLKFEHN